MFYSVEHLVAWCRPVYLEKQGVTHQGGAKSRSVLTSHLSKALINLDNIDPRGRKR